MDKAADNNKKYIKYVKIVLWSLLGLFGAFIVVALASLMIQKFILKSPAPSFLGYSILIVETGSMSGTIEENDLIIIRIADENEEFKCGQIVTYIREGEKKPTTHRLFEPGPTDGTFYPKGDANDDIDRPYITEDDILGKYVFRIPKVGWVFKWFTEGGGIVYFIAMIAIIVVGSYFWHISGSTEEAEAVAEGDGTIESIKEGVLPIQTNEDGAAAPSDANMEDPTDAPLSGADNLDKEQQDGE